MGFGRVSNAFKLQPTVHLNSSEIQAFLATLDNLFAAALKSMMAITSKLDKKAYCFNRGMNCR
jgi:hypothetical protein